MFSKWVTTANGKIFMKGLCLALAAVNTEFGVTGLDHGH